MVIAWKLHACNAVAWLLVEACWVRRDENGQPYGIAADLATYFGLAILPAIIISWIMEERARRRFMQEHHYSIDDVGGPMQTFCQGPPARYVRSLQPAGGSSDAHQ